MASTNHLELVHAPYKPSPRRPNLFVVGVVKGGTTSLYNYLQQHPEVFLTPIKETNFFAYEDLVPNKFLPEYARDIKLDIKKYLSQSERPIVHNAVISEWAQYQRLYEGSERMAIKGEVCPSYAICPSAAQMIHKYAPDAKIVFMLRNPVSRAWSQYLMNLREGKTTEQNFIAEVFNDHNRSDKGWGVNHQYLELGMYYEQITRYMQLFPVQNIQVIIQEEFKTQPQRTMNELFQTLSLTPIKIDMSEKFNSASLPRSQNLNSILVRSGAIKFMKDLVGRSTRKKLASILYSSKNLPELSAQDRLRMYAFYKQDITKLSQLFHKDLSQLWGFN